MASSAGAPNHATSQDAAPGPTPGAAPGGDAVPRATSPWRFGIGMFGTTLPITALRGSILYLYVTVLGLPSTAYAAIFTAYAIIDALDNPIFGWLSDRTRTRWGRRKPYLVGGSILLGLATIALFSVPGGIARNIPLLTVWLAVFAILMEMMDSIVTANYGALLPELFASEKQRALANAVKHGAELVGLAVALGLTPVLARNVLGCDRPAGLCADGTLNCPDAVAACPDPAIGFTRLAAIYAVIAIGVILYMALGVHERPGALAPRQPKLWPTVKQILTTRYLWSVGSVGACYGVAMGLVISGAQSFVLYTLGGDGIATTVILSAILLTSLVFLAAWMRLVRRKGAAWTWRLALPVAAAGFIPLYFAHDMVTGLIGGMCVAVGWSGMLATNDLMTARVLDADAARYGVRREGVFLAAFGVLNKVSSLLIGVATASLAWLFGYVSGQQPGPDPAGAWRMFLTVYPGALFVLGTLISCFIRLPAARTIPMPD